MNLKRKFEQDRNNSTLNKTLRDCVNFSFLRRISRIEEDEGGVKKERETREKERERERETNILSPTDIELAEEIGFIFDEKGLFSLLRVASPYYKITLYVNGVFDRWGTRHNCV